jgi:GLPGLI family protein
MLNKQYLFTLFTVCALSSAVGQEIKIDDAVYRCTYQVTTVKDTIDVQSFVLQDVMALDIGEKSAVFYSLQKEKSDSIRKKAVVSGFLDRSALASSPKGVNKYVVYLNHPADKITYKEEIFGKSHSYYYQEDLSYPSWTLDSEKAMIAGYPCQLATCAYRGRTYQAWFTMEIPLSYGPYKFGGLPGLVLKVQDTRGHYTFEAIGFERLTPAVPINYNVASFKQVAMKDLLKIQREYMADPIGWINQNTGMQIALAPDSPGEPKVREYRYLPIEISQ